VCDVVASENRSPHDAAAPALTSAADAATHFSVTHIHSKLSTSICRHWRHTAITDNWHVTTSSITTAPKTQQCRGHADYRAQMQWLIISFRAQQWALLYLLIFGSYSPAVWNSLLSAGWTAFQQTFIMPLPTETEEDVCILTRVTRLPQVTAINDCSSTA